MAREYLTHETNDPNTDHDTVSLKSIDDKGVTVFFDGDPSDTSAMSQKHYDDLVTGDDWTERGFVTPECIA